MPVIGGVLLPRQLCGEIVRELEREACWQWAEINYGKGEPSQVDRDFRSSQWCLVPPSCEPLIAARLLAVARGLERELGPFRGFEGPNIVRYRSGDFLRRHCDEDPAKRLYRRKVAIIAFLNDRGFEGGVLRVHPPNGGSPRDIVPAAGRFVAFPAETMHEVTPIRGGNRYVLVAWLH